MQYDKRTQSQLFEDFKQLLETETVDGDAKIQAVLDMLDAIIKAPQFVVH